MKPTAVSSSKLIDDNKFLVPPPPHMSKNSLIDTPNFNMTEESYTHLESAQNTPSAKAMPALLEEDMLLTLISEQVKEAAPYTY